MIRIGVGITTRNRPEVLEVALQHHTRFHPFNNPFEQAVVQTVVIDDESTRENTTINHEIIQRFYPKDWYHHWFQQRQGIAKAKNTCLIALGKCDYYFLFDDDCWPKEHGWAEYYIKTAKRAGVEHLMHLHELGDLKPTNSDELITEFSGCGGVLLFMTRKAVETVGGYRRDFGIYGFEHADYSQRCFRAGLHNGRGPFIAPTKTRDFIYSVDFNLVHFGEQPPLKDLSGVKCNSSLDVEREKLQQYINHNAQFYNNGPVYEAL